MCFMILFILSLGPFFGVPTYLDTLVYVGICRCHDHYSAVMQIAANIIQLYDPTCVPCASFRLFLLMLCGNILFDLDRS